MILVAVIMEYMYRQIQKLPQVEVSDAEKAQKALAELELPQARHTLPRH